MYSSANISKNHFRKLQKQQQPKLVGITSHCSACMSVGLDPAMQITNHIISHFCWGTGVYLIHMDVAAKWHPVLSNNFSTIQS